MILPSGGLIFSVLACSTRKRCQTKVIKTGNCICIWIPSQIKVEKVEIVFVYEYLPVLIITFWLDNLDPTETIKTPNERTFYFSILNHFELLTLIQSFHSISTFLVDRGLIASRGECLCGLDMVLKERQNTPDGFIWESPAKNCRRMQSIRTGSFFED